MAILIQLLMVIHRELNTILKMQSATIYTGDQKATVDKYISKLDESFNSILEKEKESSK